MTLKNPKLSDFMAGSLEYLDTALYFIKARGGTIRQDILIEGLLKFYNTTETTMEGILRGAPETLKFENGMVTQIGNPPHLNEKNLRLYNFFQDNPQNSYSIDDIDLPGISKMSLRLYLAHLFIAGKIYMICKLNNDGLPDFAINPRFTIVNDSQEPHEHRILGYDEIVFKFPRTAYMDKEKYEGAEVTEEIQDITHTWR